MSNLKFLGLTVPEILGGPEIPKLGHVTLTWPLLTQFCILFLRAHRRPSPC